MLESEGNCYQNGSLLYHITYPNMALHFQGNPKRKCDTIPPVIASAKHGVKASLITAKESFLSLMTSSPSPARVKITVRANFLQINNKIVMSFMEILFHKGPINN